MFYGRIKMSPMKAVIAVVCLIAAKIQISAASNGTGETKF